MYICNYCGRHLKKKYDKCPACGSDSFEKIISEGVEIIKTPPKDGYKINTKNIKHKLFENKIPLYFGLAMIGFVLIFCLSFFLTGISIISKDDKLFGYLFLGFTVLFIVVFIINVIKAVNEVRTDDKDSDRYKKIEKLVKNGLLIKNLPYKLEAIKNNNSSKTVYCIKVVFEIEKGRTLSLKSEPKYYTKLGRADGTVDLLIDPDDYTNYFIDFEIY